MLHVIEVEVIMLNTRTFANTVTLPGLTVLYFTLQGRTDTLLSHTLGYRGV